MVVDVEFGLPDRARRHIHETLDYRLVHETVKGVVLGKEHPLIEGLAHELAHAVQALGPEWVRVRVRKPAPPIADFAGSVEAEASLGQVPPGC